MAEQSASERHGVSTPRVVERGPGSSGRYLRYDTILGRGAFKTVYKGFDEREGIEVAWNQIKSNDIVKEGERLTTEINVLKNMKHKNVMYFYESWVDRESGTVNFITELFTSGTLRQYRQKHKNLNKNALKRWAWQILQGLVYLHGHDPPIIHRDLKCDNIFVNGSAGVVKIGDLGLATLLRGTTAPQSCLGTPEFMAPELYEERYNEKVDVYGFGMCMLELATMQYPYSECVNAAQIYKRVSQGRYPEGLKAVEDDELREFIQLCISHASDARPEARRLLKHSFFEDIRKSAQAANEERAIEKAATGDIVKDRTSLAGSSGSGLSEQSHSGSVEEAAAREESAAASAALLTDAIKEVYVSAEVQGNNRSHSGFGRVVSMEVGNLPQPNGEKCNIEFSFELGVDSVKDIIHEMQAELNLDLADIDAHVIEEKIDVELQKVMGDGLRSWSSLLTSAGSCRAQAELEAQGDRSSFTLSPQLTSSLRHSTAAGLDDLGLGDAPPPVFHPTDVSAFESTRGSSYSRAGGDAQSRVSSNEGFTFAPRPSEYTSSRCSLPEAPPRSSTSASPPPGRGASGTERHGLSPPRISSTSSVAHDGRHESDTISGARKDKLSFREIRSCIDQAHAAGLLHGTRA